MRFIIYNIHIFLSDSNAQYPIKKSFIQEKPEDFIISKADCPEWMDLLTEHADLFAEMGSLYQPL